MSNLVSKIKALFEEANPATEVNFKDVKTDSGLLLRITGDIALDSKVQEIKEDGTLADLLDGDYTLEDGTTISVLGGKIAEVSSAEEEAVDANEGESEMAVEVEAPPATEEVPAEKEATIEERMMACEKKLSEVVELMNKMAGNMSETTTENEKLKAENAEFKANFEAEVAKNEELAKKAAAPAVSLKKFEKEETKLNIKNLSLVDKIQRMKNNNN
jgi:hypothetical protein